MQQQQLIITSPLNSITNRMASHRSAQAIIYADMLKKYSPVIDFGNSEPNFNNYAVMAVYHGNDFGGGLNIFGGLKNEEVASQLVKFSEFTGKVISLGIDFPDYKQLIKSRLDKSKDYPDIWNKINFDNLDRMRIESKLFVNPKDSIKSAVGDSHAISLYRSGWKLNSVPFKTLNGALNDGLEKYIPDNTEEVEFLFGAIDIRHHLCRISEDYETNAKELALRYIDAVSKLPINKKTIYTPLPLENESRKIPTTGCYKGKPFWGSWENRNAARNKFIETLKEYSGDISVIDPWSYLLNSKGELDMAYMEKPRSVHLSREFYPFWTGEEFNKKNNKPEKIKVELKNKKSVVRNAPTNINFDWYKFDPELMKDFNWFLYKVNQRACINLGFIDDKYEEVNRYGEFDYGLGKDVDWFHTNLVLDDRMRFIAENISQADMSLFNIIGNTFISHFLGARGVHQIITQSNDLTKCYVDFDRIIENDQEYLEKIRSNIDYAKLNKWPIWGTTELHTSIQTAARNYCRIKYNNPNREFHPADVCEWVASFKSNGIYEKMINAEHMQEVYQILKSQPGIGDYYGFHGAASTSVLPQLKHHNDQKFVAPGPGAIYTIRKIWPDVPNKFLPDAVYFLRENADEIGLTKNVEFHPKAYNIWVNNKPILEHNQDSLKYYGTEVLCCQFGIYLQIRNDKKQCEKRRVSRTQNLTFPKSLV